MAKVLVIMVARDIAPSQAFEMVAKELGEQAVCLLGMGKPPKFSLDDVRAAVQRASVVLVGMSSSAELAEPEIAACEEAVKNQISFGFYCDRFGTYTRPWAEKFRGLAKFLFVVNEKEAAGARQLFPTAEVVVSGNPTWEDYSTPKYSREEVRARFGVAPKEVMVLSPSTKSGVVSAITWGALIHTIHSALLSGLKLRLFLAPHPGDPTPEIYADFKKFSKVPVEVLGKDIKTSELVPGCDIVVEYPSSVAIEAAHQRKPIISFLTETGFRRLESVEGTREWELCRLGVSEPVVGSPDELGKAISRLLTPESFAPQRKRQEEVFPAAPEKGAAIRKMIAVLQKFA